VGKALAILDLVASSKKSVSLSDIVRRTGIAKATVHRHLMMLGVHAVVQRNREGYVLGPRSRNWIQASIEATSLDSLRSTIPHLVDLHRETELATVLAVLSYRHVVYLERLHDRRQLWQVGPVQGRNLAHCTASGKALLAFDVVASERFFQAGRL